MINVSRSKEAPASLKEKKSWSGLDVMKALHRDFLGKCYLCEGMVGEGGFEVDHRAPKSTQKGKNKKYTWKNLYPVHHDCNNRRQRKWPEGGLLFPADGDDVESKLLQKIDWTNSPGDPLLCFFAAADPADQPAANTAKELHRLHSGEGGAAEAELKALDLRRAIHNQLTQYLLEERKLLADPNDLGSLQRLRKLVARSSPYTMLLRSVIHDSLRDRLLNP